MGDTSKMPWKDTGPVAERKQFIEDCLAGGRRDLAGLSRTYGISRKTRHKWVQRFLAGGVAALEDRSHARQDRTGRVPAEMERRLRAARRVHPTWGPKKLRAWLAAAEPGTDWPAESTIGEVLRRAGLTQPRAQPKRPAAAGVPNALWTIDYKGQFRTGDGVWLYPLTMHDAHSRYLLGCAGQRQVSGPATRATLQKVFREHCLAERLRSDNGSPFASVGAGRLSKLAAWWLKLGIELERIQPGKP